MLFKQVILESGNQKYQENRPGQGTGQKQARPVQMSDMQRADVY